MLYHPCAHPAEVAKLKKLVKSCIGKHVITPSTLLTPERVSGAALCIDCCVFYIK